MNKFKIGDKIRAIDDEYTFTNKSYGCEGEVVELKGVGEIQIKITKHKFSSEIGEKYKVEEKHFELIKEEKVMFRIGDKVRAIDNRYGITNMKHNCEGEVIDTRISSLDDIQIKITKHAQDFRIGDSFWVNSEHFELIEKEFKVGDIIRAIDDEYNITSKENHCECVVTHGVDTYGEIEVKVTKCDEKFSIGNTYSVEPKHFELIESVKVDVEEEERMFKLGDIVIAKDNHYNYTSKDNDFKGEVVAVRPEGVIDVKTLECLVKSKIGHIYDVEEKHFELYKAVTEFKVGDIVEAIDNEYAYTSMEKNFRGEIVEVYGTGMTVKILECDVESQIGEQYCVGREHFKIAEPRAKFKVGDVVTGVKSYQTMNGKRDVVTKVTKDGLNDYSYTLKDTYGRWFDFELEKIDSNSHTFAEVLSMIKEGEVYAPIKSDSNIGRVYQKHNNIFIENKAGDSESLTNFNKDALFKKVDEFQEVKICEVKYGVSEEVLKFLADDFEEDYEDEFVVCITEDGKLYGKCIREDMVMLSKEEISKLDVCELA